jgi:hypothetical protein
VIDGSATRVASPARPSPARVSRARARSSLPGFTCISEDREAAARRHGRTPGLWQAGHTWISYSMQHFRPR